MIINNDFLDNIWCTTYTMRIFKDIISFIIGWKTEFKLE